MTAPQLDFVEPGDRVMVIGRRRNFSRVRALGDQFFPDCDVDIWSGERLGGSSVNWWGHEFYDQFDAIEDAESPSPPGLSADDVEDIVRRCRILRLVDEDEARTRAVAGYRAWHRILCEHDYSFVLLMPVDSFVLDTLARAARQLGIPALYPVGTPFAQRVRFTDRGPLRGRLPLDDLDRDERESEAERLRQDHFRPGWLFGVDAIPAATILRRMVWDTVKTVPHAAYRLLARDPKSFSFAPFRLHRQSKWSTPSKAFAAIRAERASVGELPSEFVFMPLQTYPEVSTDYWIRDLEARPEPEALVRLVDHLRKELPVVVKEHPAVVGRRSASQLDAFRKMDDVHFVPLLSPVGALIREADLVVGTGSTSMFQALVNRKRTLFLGRPYYGAEGAPIIRDLRDGDHVRERIGEAIAADRPSRDDADRVLTRLFSATAPTDLGSVPPLGEASFGDSGEPRVHEKAFRLLNNAVADLPGESNGDSPGRC